MSTVTSHGFAGRHRRSALIPPLRSTAEAASVATSRAKTSASAKFDFPLPLAPTSAENGASSTLTDSMLR